MDAPSYNPFAKHRQRRYAGFPFAGSARCYFRVIALLFLAGCFSAPALLCGCEPGNARTPREALDCSVTLIERTNTRGACQTFMAAYDRLVPSGRISEFPLADIERFYFEGGETLLSYSWRVSKREDKIAAAARAENFFTQYMTWFGRLTDQQKQSLPDGGRIRTVVSFLGNALIAQERKSELPYYYISNVGDAALFGPDAIKLWERTLNDVFGEPKKGSSTPKGQDEWREFAEFTKEWADVPGLLPKAMRNHFMGRAARILDNLT